MLSNTRTMLLSLVLAAPLAACGDDGGAGSPDAMQSGPDASSIDAGSTVCFDEETFFKAAGRGNTFGTDPGLNDPFDVTAPDFAPADGAPVLAGGATPPDDGFFDTAATFIGAIGADDWTAGWTAYPIDVPGVELGSLPASTVEKAGEIDADETWTADNVYVLTGKVFVNAVLTIEPGTVIRGQNGSALVIAQEGSIDAAGTADDPIVFTSSKDSGAAAGDWGGVVLIGRAPINVQGGSDVVEGFEQSEEDKVRYGGTDPADDCGTLRYVRIEYAGFELSQNNELNGLTVAGCGSDTELDFLQIHRGLDDGIEFFGGTANVKHLVVTHADDDSLDCDYGWQGKGQFIILKQDANTGDKGIECDNNGDNNDATPRTTPEIWNMTMIGSNDFASADTQGGMHLRRGMAGSIHNAIIAYFRSFAVDVDGVVTVQQAEAGDLSIESSYFYQNAGGDGFPAGFDARDGAENDCSAE